MKTLRASIFPLFAATLPVCAVDQAGLDAARKIYQEKQNAVVAVSAVIKLQLNLTGGSGGNQTQEQKVEMLGTVVNAEGLTVVNYSALDVSSQVMSQLKGRLPAGVKLDIKADFKEVKLITGDGDEIPADVVLKDADLDIAFIKPDQSTDEFKGASFEPIALTPPSTEPAVLDEVVLIERTGKDLNRRATVNFARVVAIQNKPRTFYILNETGGGTPVFDLKGNLLGIFTRRVFDGAAASTVLLPVKDIAQVAKQAETAKPLPKAVEEAPKKEEKKDEKKDEPKDKEAAAPEKKEEAPKADATPGAK